MTAPRSVPTMKKALVPTAAFSLAGVLRTSPSTSAIGGNAFVTGSVYGGCENGQVLRNTQVKITGNCQIGVCPSEIRVIGDREIGGRQDGLGGLGNDLPALRRRCSGGVADELEAVFRLRREAESNGGERRALLGLNGSGQFSVPVPEIRDPADRGPPDRDPRVYRDGGRVSYGRDHYLGTVEGIGADDAVDDSPLIGLICEYDTLSGDCLDGILRGYPDSGGVLDRDRHGLFFFRSFFPRSDRKAR